MVVSLCRSVSFRPSGIVGLRLDKASLLKLFAKPSPLRTVFLLTVLFSPYTSEITPQNFNFSIVVFVAVVRFLDFLFRFFIYFMLSLFLLPIPLLVQTLTSLDLCA